MQENLTNKLTMVTHKNKHDTCNGATNGLRTCSLIGKRLKCDTFGRGVKPEDVMQELFLRKVHSIFGFKTVYYQSNEVFSSRKIKKDFESGKDVSKILPKPVYKLFVEKEKKDKRKKDVKAFIESKIINNEIEKKESFKTGT